MPHVRQQLVTAAVAALTGLPSTGARVFDDRPEQHELQETELPALLVYDDGEPAVESLALASRIYDRTVALRVAAVVKATSGAAVTARQICAEVEAALGVALTVDGRAVDLWYRRTEFSAPDASADQPVARVTLFFEAQMATAAAAPDVLVSY